MFFGNIHHFFVEFYHGDFFNGFVAKDFAKGGAFAASQDGNVLRCRMGKHGRLH